MYIHACIHAWVVMGEMVLVLEEEDEEEVVVVVEVVVLVVVFFGGRGVFLEVLCV